MAPLTSWPGLPQTRDPKPPTHPTLHAAAAIDDWQVREGRLRASDTAALYQEARAVLRAALKKVYAHDGSDQLAAGSGVGTASAGGSLAASVSVATMPAALRLPLCAKHLLLAAHLASRFPPRLDVAIFSAVRRGGGGKRRRALRKPPAAAEPHAFTLERLLAIYDSVSPPVPRATRDHAAAAHAHAAHSRLSTCRAVQPCPPSREPHSPPPRALLRSMRPISPRCLHLSAPLMPSARTVRAPLLLLLAAFSRSKTRRR